MLIKIGSLIVLLFLFSVVSSAQIVSNDEVSNIVETPQTIKLDEFEIGGECDIGARIDSIFIELNNNPTSTAYIISYRGSEDLPSRQTDGFVQTQFNKIKRAMAFRKYDTSRITIIEGGFRKSETFINEVWLVPQDGIIPQPTETVEKPKLAKNKAYLADEKYNAIIYLASFAQQEAEKLAEENQETDETEEPTETEQIDVEQEIDSENTETEEVEIDESSELYWGFSNYFGDTLEANQNFRGTIIYYADGEEYDLKKSHELMLEFLENFKTRNKIDLKRIRLIYGGYRKNIEIEYWIVPKGAKEPQPKPEIKFVEKEN